MFITAITSINKYNTTANEQSDKVVNNMHKQTNWKCSPIRSLPTTWDHQQRDTAMYMREKCHRNTTI